MKKYIYIMFAVAGWLTACMKESIQPEPEVAVKENNGFSASGIRIPVRMENGVTKSSDNEFMFCFDDSTKVDISSTTGAATWTTGDQIVLCESNGVYTYWLYGDVDTESSEVSVTLDDGYSRVNYAIYPASAATSNFTTPTVVYADSYSMDGVANPETFSMAPMVAINSGQLNFYHVGAMLRLSLSFIPPYARKIRVTFNGITYVTGTYSVSNPGTASASTTLSSGSHNYVDYTKSTNFDIVTALNIPLPTGDYTSCTGLTVGYYDENDDLITSQDIEFPYKALFRASGKKTAGANVYTDLSKVHPLTREAMPRETANCYIVTEPGLYCLPLIYGNAVVNGMDNLSTAAPVKSNENCGDFVNAYDQVITSGNIKADVENAGHTLNMSGGKLVWSTYNTNSQCLLSVRKEIGITDGIAYLFFNVPEEGFQNGSCLIGILKDAFLSSDPEYVWGWHIWITNGNQLYAEEYTNYEGLTISFLNRSIGGTLNDSPYPGGYYTRYYYPYGVIYPIGCNSLTLLKDTNVSFSYSSITNPTLGQRISKPHKYSSTTSYYSLAGGTYYFRNIWDATQTGTSWKKVIKTIYDPSPAGMCVPRPDAFTGFLKNGNISSSSNQNSNLNIITSYQGNLKVKKNAYDDTGSVWNPTGYMSSGTTATYSSSYGYYWTACTSNDFGKNTYLCFYVYNNSSQCYVSSYYYNLAIRPTLCE